MLCSIAGSSLLSVSKTKIMYWPLHGFEKLGNDHPVTEHNIPEETSSLMSIVFIVFIIELFHHLCTKLRKNMENLRQDMYVDITGAVFFQ